MTPAQKLAAAKLKYVGRYIKFKHATGLTKPIKCFSVNLVTSSFGGGTRYYFYDKYDKLILQTNNLKSIKVAKNEGDI